MKKKEEEENRIEQQLGVILSFRLNLFTEKHSLEDSTDDWDC